MTTVPPELAALLAGARAQPEEDAPRLVLADWLEEHREEERAEFIRLEGQVARMNWIGKPAFTADIDRRVLDLLGRKGAEWLRPLGGLVRQAIWRRGTVGLGGEGDWFLRESEAIADQTHAFPWIDTLRLSNVRTIVQPLAASPHLAAFSRLEFGFRALDGEHLAALVSSPHLANAGVLELSCNSLGDRGAFALAESPHLNRLTGLYLVDTGISVEGMKALVSSPHLSNLTHLDLGRGSTIDSIGDAGIEVLANSFRLPRLTALGLRTNKISPGGAEILASSPWLSQFTILDLTDNDLGDAGVEALAASPQVTQLTALGLRDNKVGPAGGRALVRSPNLPRLNLLMFGVDDKVGGPGTKALRNRFGDGVWSTRRLRGY